MPTMEELIEESNDKFESYFGTDPTIREAFKECVINVLKDVYRDNPERFKERLTEVIERGNEVYDLNRYLRVACIDEGEDKPLGYEEALMIIGPKPVKKGDTLYHFSHKRHLIGFHGHEGMCFTSEDDFSSIASDSVDRTEPVHSHVCIVLNPKKILDHHAKALLEGISRRDELIEDCMFFVEEDPYNPRWYEAKGKGAIEVVSLKQVI